MRVMRAAKKSQSTCSATGGGFGGGEPSSHLNHLRSVWIIADSVEA